MISLQYENAVSKVNPELQYDHISNDGGNPSRETSRETTIKVGHAHLD